MARVGLSVTSAVDQRVALVSLLCLGAEFQRIRRDNASIPGSLQIGGRLEGWKVEGTIGATQAWHALSDHVIDEIDRT